MFHEKLHQFTPLTCLSFSSSLEASLGDSERRLSPLETWRHSPRPQKSRLERPLLQRRREEGCPLTATNTIQGKFSISNNIDTFTLQLMFHEKLHQFTPLTCLSFSSSLEASHGDSERRLSPLETWRHSPLPQKSRPELPERQAAMSKYNMSALTLSYDHYLMTKSTYSEL
jgi:hypothetical protein